MGFSQKGTKCDGKVSLNQTVHTLKEKDVKSNAFLKKLLAPRQNAWENVHQARPLRRNPRDFCRPGLALLGCAAVPDAWGKGSLSPAARCVRAETHGRSADKSHQTTSNSARALFYDELSGTLGQLLVTPRTLSRNPRGERGYGPIGPRPTPRKVRRLPAQQYNS